MKILLVVHDTNTPFNIFPNGIGYLAAVLQQAGHTVLVFDQATSHLSNSALVSFIQAEGPFDFIGMGFLSSFYHEALATCTAIRAACGETPFLLGGNAPSATPQYCLEKFKADYVMRGECDLSILKFVKMLQGEIKPEQVRGLCWKDDGEIRVTPRDIPPQDLDDIPFPAWDLFDMKSYTFPRRIPGVPGLAVPLGILTSRGCPYKCKFCFRLEPQYRMRSTQSCIEEIGYLIKKYRINFAYFYDDLFMASKQRTLEFCESILHSGLKFNWSCTGRFNIADREQLREMKKAGCAYILYGLESGDQKILDEMDKRINVDHVLDVANITKEEGIMVSISGMFGIPGETTLSLKKTVDMIIACTSWHDKRTIRPMQPYPGSPYFNENLLTGKLKDVDDFYTRYIGSEKRTVNMTDIPDNEFDRALYDANERLLREHYRHAFETDMEMLHQVYFNQNLEGFIPFRY